MQTAFAIRLASAHELPRLREIERRAGRGFLDQGVTLDDGEPTPLEDLARALARDRLFVAADAGDRAVGFAMLVEVDGHAHLDEIDVDPAHARRGIGHALLEHVCAWASAHGHRALTLTTFREVPWNRPFYERRGFEVVPLAEVGPQMRAVIAEETRWGFDWRERCVMRRFLDPASDSRPRAGPRGPTL